MLKANIKSNGDDNFGSASIEVSGDIPTLCADISYMISEIVSKVYDNDAKAGEKFFKILTETISMDNKKMFLYSESKGETAYDSILEKEEERTLKIDKILKGLESINASSNQTNSELVAQVEIMKKVVRDVEAIVNPTEISEEAEDIISMLDSIIGLMSDDSPIAKKFGKKEAINIIKTFGGNGSKSLEAMKDRTDKMLKDLKSNSGKEC